MPVATTAIHVAGLKKRYPGFRHPVAALAGVDFEVSRADVFGFLWIFLLFAVGTNPASSGFGTAIATLYLLDPNLLFQMLVGFAIPTIGGGGGFVPPGYISVVAVVTAVVLWIAVPLVLTLLVFRWKAES